MSEILEKRLCIYKLGTEDKLAKDCKNQECRTCNGYELRECYIPLPKKIYDSKNGR